MTKQDKSSAKRVYQGVKEIANLIRVVGSHPIFHGWSNLQL